MYCSTPLILYHKLEHPRISNEVFHQGIRGENKSTYIQLDIHFVRSIVYPPFDYTTTQPNGFYCLSLQLWKEVIEPETKKR